SLLYIWRYKRIKPSAAPAFSHDDNETSLSAGDFFAAVIPPLLLIIAVLGSILIGAATPTEAAAIGAFGAILLAAFRGALTIDCLRSVCQQTLKVTSMVFMILIGATLFSLVFRAYGGDELIQSFFNGLPGGKMAALIVVMLAIFVLGFILDFIEITFVVVPIVGPILMAMGVDPIWLGILIAVNLQTSFLTPPFGFALFYLRGVAPASVKTGTIYRGVIPYIVIQLLMLVLLILQPGIVTWLPNTIR
ncbi:TRAP transporter large permease subunit, partial [bacterium]|nr:TRAP transporter large permease subunit [bacterium]